MFASLMGNKFAIVGFFALAMNNRWMSVLGSLIHALCYTRL